MANSRESKPYIWVTCSADCCPGTIGASGRHGSRPTTRATLGPGRTLILIMSDRKWSIAGCCGSPGKGWKTMAI